MTDRYLLCEMGRQGVRDVPAQMKPRISPRRGLSGQRLWVCMTVEPAREPMLNTIVLGYGYTPSEAFKEWEECRV